MECPGTSKQVDKFHCELVSSFNALGEYCSSSTMVPKLVESGFVSQLTNTTLLNIALHNQKMNIN